MELKTFEINGREYKADLSKVSFQQALNIKAKLKSGMIATYENEVMTINFTEEYAKKEIEAIKDLLITIYSLDINIDEIPVTIALDMFDEVKNSPFFYRLQDKKV